MSQESESQIKNEKVLASVTFVSGIGTGGFSSSSATLPLCVPNCNINVDPTGIAVTWHLHCLNTLILNVPLNSVAIVLLANCKIISESHKQEVSKVSDVSIKVVWAFMPSGIEIELGHPHFIIVGHFSSLYFSLSSGSWYPFLI